MTSETSRPLAIRLREYLDNGRRVSAKILQIAENLEERFPGENQVLELKATANTMSVLANDLEKMLAGEELPGWSIEINGKKVGEGHGDEELGA